MLQERYIRNAAAISPEECGRLHDSAVAVIGCGGLGGYVIEILGRLGIGHIRAVDGDCFEPSNLNRQLLATEENLGSLKAQAAADRMSRVNHLVTVEAVPQMLNQDNAASLLQDMDLVIDALDCRESRMILQEAAKASSIPLVHGAVAGWYGRITTVFPGDDTLSRLYPAAKKSGAEKVLGTPSFAPPLIASLQVSEAVKVLLHKGEPLCNQYLYIDLLSNMFHIARI